MTGTGDGEWGWGALALARPVSAGDAKEPSSLFRSPYLQLGYQLLFTQVLLLHHLQPSILQDLPAARVQAITDEHFPQICKGHCWSQPRNLPLPPGRSA